MGYCECIAVPDPVTARSSIKRHAKGPHELNINIYRYWGNLWFVFFLVGGLLLNASCTVLLADPMECTKLHGLAFPPNPPQGPIMGGR